MIRIGPLNPSEGTGFPFQRPRDQERGGKKVGNKKPEAPTTPRPRNREDGKGTILDIDV